MNSIIDLLKAGKDLSQKQSKSVLKKILKGTYTEEDVYAFIEAYEAKAYHAEEWIGFLSAMRELAMPFKHHVKDPIIDVCGTGGSDQERFNVSTCVTFVLAAENIHVAKHGNYGSRRPNGSFNFLEELQVVYKLDALQAADILSKAKCCFLFARLYHPLMRHVSTVRKRFKKRTVFNYLGPLANPIDVSYQLLGLSSDEHIDVLIQTIQALPRKKVLLVMGGDGKDEVSLSGTTRCIQVEPDKVTRFDINFSKEIEALEPHECQYECGDSQKNATLLVQIALDKQWDHPVIKHICINAAAALVMMGESKTVQDGYQRAMNVFKEERFVQAINRYKSLSVDMIMP